MPLNIKKNLPAVDILKSENIFVMDDLRASSQDIRPLRVCILNLMPMKIVAETDFIRLLSNSPLQIEVTFLKIENHVSKNTSEQHMNEFYKSFDEIKNDYFDGLICSGAPVEHLAFEEVDYWKDIRRIFDWAHVHVTSTLYICWSAQAALYHFYGIEKYPLKEKMFGVFEHKVLLPKFPLFRGFDDIFFVPHSRHTEVRKQDILSTEGLNLLAESKTAGVHIVMSRGGREFYIMGHSEYSPEALHKEYIRDKEKGLPIKIPFNYYKNDDPSQGVLVRWRSHGNLFFTNWLNYFVYQSTPFVPDTIRNLGDLNV